MNTGVTTRASRDTALKTLIRSPLPRALQPPVAMCSLPLRRALDAHRRRDGARRQHHLRRELFEAALHRHVDEAAAVLAVADDEAGDELLVDLRLKLDVLRAGKLLELLRDEELLLVLELDGARDRRHLRLRDLAVELLEGLEDRLNGVNALLVNEKAKEVQGEGVELRLLGDLRQDVLLRLAFEDGVGEELERLRGLAQERFNEFKFIVYQADEYS